MASFGETFERIEKKYRITASQRAELESYMLEHMQLGEYGTHTVSSLYLDTNSRDLICRSLEKPLYKEKLRIRYYGDIRTLSATSPVFVELKKKFKGVVYKRRLCITWQAAQAFFAGMPYEEACNTYPLADARAARESLSTRSIQISREIAQFAIFHSQLEQSMLIACRRTAYAKRETPATTAFPVAGASASAAVIDDDLRITFDDHIAYTDLLADGSALAHGSLLAPGESLMEIKVRGAMPIWLTRALTECGIKPTSFSKYGEAYKATLSPASRQVLIAS